MAPDENYHDVIVLPYVDMLYCIVNYYELRSPIPQPDSIWERGGAGTSHASKK